MGALPHQRVHYLLTIRARLPPKVAAMIVWVEYNAGEYIVAFRKPPTEADGWGLYECSVVVPEAIWDTDAAVAKICLEAP